MKMHAMKAVPGETPKPRVLTVAATAVSLAMVMVTGGVASFATAADDTERRGMVAPEADCASLGSLTLADVQVTAVTKVAATANVPGYCKVLGTEVGTEHDIEVRLPDEWQNRFIQNGGGGFDGSLRAIPDSQLNLGAVAAANNGGHRDPSGAVFLGNPEVQALYAHTAIETTARFSKELAARYYMAEPSFSYYLGCSNGGRGALNAAAKYSDEFDGVIAGAPTQNLGGQIAAWTRTAGLQLPSAEEAAAIQAVIVAKYDALDGLEDGIVSNMEAVDFDPATDIPAEIGLTEAEAEAVAAVMTDVVAFGETVYSRYSAPAAAAAGYAPFLGIGHMQNVILNDATWDPSAFDVETYLPTIERVVGDLGFNASARGLANFMDDGKKVMIWHGTADALLSENDTVRNWNEVRKAAGDPVADDNSRLYMAPGVDHCGGGAGADTFDLLPAMIDWVERDLAPETIIASKIDRASGATLFTRPLCEYPTYPRYSGAGNANDAANFKCVENADAPSAPRDPVANVDGNSVSVRWSAPDSDGGAAVDQYEVRLSDGQMATVDGVVMSATFVDLEPGKYTAVVRARNAAGLSEPSAASNTVEVVADPSEDPEAFATLSVSGPMVPGGEIFVQGSGFDPGATYMLELRSTPAVLGDVQVDDAGAFQLGARIPASVEPGAHTLVAIRDGVDIAQVELELAAAPSSEDDGDSGSADSKAGSGVSDGLAATGADTSVLAGWTIVGAVLLFAGAAFVVLRRRRAA